MSCCSVVLVSVLLTLCQPTASTNSSRVLNYNLYEARPNGTFIGNVKTDSSLAKSYSSADLASMWFTLRLPSTYMTINATTGVLRSSKVIDRSVICPYLDTCDLTVDVEVMPVQFFQIYRVVVRVLSINAHSPTFIPSSVVLTISETTPPRTEFALPSADDPDGGVDGVQKYNLVTVAQGTFQLVVSDLVDGSNDVRLQLMTMLDRSVRSFYSLTVVAVDGGSPPKSGTLTINVTVRATSADCGLSFPNDTYSVSINENVPVGTLVTKVNTKVNINCQQTGTTVRYAFDDYTSVRYRQVSSYDSFMELTGQ